ncbi:MAG: iron-containing alcohol dehydrogenase [Pseudonocardiaceae bacterium]|nr:iron-containing alcohol dehydrogenase [Pseudonocardiaceae bacterium]
MTTTAPTTAGPAPLAGRFDVIPLESVVFGPGAAGGLAAECERLGMSRLLLIASPSLARRLDMRAVFDAATGGRVAGVFTGGRPHVPDDVVLAAAEAARAAGADGVLSVGGGSVVDLGKAVSLCVAEGVRTREELLAWRVVFEYPATVEIPTTTAPQLPHIAVSTTLSAGEFTSIIGITDTQRLVKDLYITPSLVPRMVVLDPELAVHTPRDLWASTGLRAVDHAVEALCSTSAQPVTDALSADALHRLTRYLPVSTADSADLHAAGQCQVAAWESIFGLTNVNLGLSHGIGHQLGARCGVPHGITSCVMLPAVLDYNLEHTSPAQARIAQIFATAAGVAAEVGAGELVRRFIASLGLPTSLREVGVERSEFPALARDAMADLIVASNPRPVTGEDEVIAILDSAY